MPLPHGPWLSQLQHLALAVAAMSASLPDLAAGTSSLQKLGVYCGAGREADLVAALRWAGRLPALRELQVQAHAKNFQATREEAIDAAAAPPLRRLCDACRELDV